MRLKNLLISLFILCCLALSANATDIVRYVDTGSDAGGDGTTSATSSGDNSHAYQSGNQWESGEETDLDTANNTHTVHCNRTNAGGMDEIAFGISGWTTSATDFIKVIADDFPADGIYDATKYVLHNNDSDLAFFSLVENYINLFNLQILVTETSTNNRRGLSIIGQDAGNAINIGNCIFKGACSGTLAAQGIRVGDDDSIVTIYNTIVTGFFIESDAGFRGILAANGTVNVYNCSVYGNTTGIGREGTATVTLINTVVFNNEDDLAGTISLSYSATDDGDDSGNNGNITITQSADDWAALVVDAAGDDFNVTNSSSELYQTGNGATPKSIFTDDIIGTTRGPADLDWDIGAYELSGAPPAVVPTLYYYSRFAPVPFVIIAFCFILGRKNDSPDNRT